MDVDVFSPRHRLLLVAISKSVGSRSIYDAARFAWRLRRERVKNVEFVLGCVNGVVVGVFIPTEWLDAWPHQLIKKNFPGFDSTHNSPRIGFVGVEADNKVKQIYLGKRIPEDLEIGQCGFRYFGV